jgi:hypothetical protein
METDSLHTTELGKIRIMRNLGLKTKDIVAWCRYAILKAGKNSLTRKGKNSYVYGDGYVITVNAGSHTIITARKILNNKFRQLQPKKNKSKAKQDI